MRKHKSIIMAMAIILAIATIASASTFAWYTAQDGVKNEFRNQQWDPDGIKINERFTPPKIWIPGGEVEKAVWATNVSVGSSVVRATLAEVLLYLDSLNVTVQSAKYSSASLTLDTVLGRDFTYANTQVPKLANPDAYIPANGWTLLTATNLIGETYTDGSGANVPAIDSFTFTPVTGVDVYYKLSSAVDLITGEVEITVEFAALCEITDVIGKYDGEFQSVALTATSAMNAAKDALDVTLAVAGYETVLMGDVDTIKWEQAAALGSQVGAPASGFPIYTPGPTASNFDLVSSGVPSSYVTTASGTDSVIKILFDNVNVGPLASFSATPAMKGEWWYNTTDGYFYFLDVVLSGASTAEFVQSVTLTGDAANVHSDLAYDLYVFAEAMQPTADAVETWGPGIAAIFAAAGVTLS